MIPPRRRTPAPRRPLVRIATVVALALPLAACAPMLGAPGETRPPADTTALDDLERTAWQAWLLMELGHVRSGAYSTQALVDLDLPSGIRWTVVEFGPDGYALAVSRDVDGRTLRVAPDGVAGG